MSGTFEEVFAHIQTTIKDGFYCGSRLHIKDDNSGDVIIELRTGVDTNNKKKTLQKV